MNFRIWIEAQTALEPPKTALGSGNIDNIGIDDNDDNGDDSEWNWDNINKRYGQALLTWANASPYGKKIKTAILNIVFSQQPQIGDPDIFGYEDVGEDKISAEGEATIRVEWKYPEEQIEQKVFNTLRDARKGDLWKVFKIQPNQLWSFLDKGEVFEYVFYVIKSSIVGQSPQLYQQHYNQNAPEGQRFSPDYWAKADEWKKDKATLAKHAAFKAHELQPQLEQQVKEMVEDYYSYGRQQREETEMRFLGQKHVSGLVWKEHFVASVDLQWEYRFRQ